MCVSVSVRIVCICEKISSSMNNGDSTHMSVILSDKKRNKLNTIHNAQYNFVNWIIYF